MFNLKRPCAKCPFRTDIPGYLYGDRVDEIVSGLKAGQSFYCHETTSDEDDDEGGQTVATDESEFCAGALILMEKDGGPNQMMRIGERLRMYDHKKLDMAAPVFDTGTQMIRHHREAQGDSDQRRQRRR